MTRECRKCHKVLPLSGEYFYPRGKYFEGQCKECKSSWHKKHYRDNIESERERHRKKYAAQTPEVRAEFKRKNNIWRKTPRGRYGVYTKNAAKRGLEFKLSVDEFLGLVTSDCHYCGGGGYGIDRYDSSIGYITDNCVPCCSMCNIMKNNYTYEEFIGHCRKIIENVPFPSEGL